MVVVTGNWRIALAGLAASLLIFGVLFFAVIQPSQNTANQAVKTGLQQTQQAIAGATSKAQQTLTKATKLASCLAAAGIDASKVAACQASFGH